MSTLSPENLANKLIDYCHDNDIRFLFISGNGGSGKTQLSKTIAEQAQKNGRANFLSTDDFLASSDLRNSAPTVWEDPTKGRQKGRSTTSFAQSYFFQNIYAIIQNLDSGNDYIHWPRRGKQAEECQTLYADAKLTVIEGVGTAFMDRKHKKSLSVYLKCSREIEFDRRIARAIASDHETEEFARRTFEERRSQYEVNVEPLMKNFDIILESLKDFQAEILQDNLKVLS